jgi:hypothetical protein
VHVKQWLEDRPFGLIIQHAELAGDEQALPGAQQFQMKFSHAM